MTTEGDRKTESPNGAQRRLTRDTHMHTLAYGWLSPIAWGAYDR